MAEFWEKDVPVADEFWKRDEDADWWKRDEATPEYLSTDDAPYFDPEAIKRAPREFYSPDKPSTIRQVIDGAKNLLGKQFSLSRLTDPMTLIDPAGVIPESVKSSVTTPIPFLAQWFKGVSSQTLANAVDVLKTVGVQMDPDATAFDVETAQEQLAGPDRPPTTTEKVAAGAQSATAEAVQSFTSPMGIATLGLGFLPKTAQSAVAAIFAADMVSHMPEQAKLAADAIKRGDTEEAAKNITAFGLTGTFAALSGRHAVKAGKEAIAETKLATIGAEAAKEVGPATEATVSEITPAPEKPPGAPPKLAPAGLGIVPDAKLTELVGPLAQKSFWQKWFTAAGNLPEEVFQSWQKRGGKVSEETRRAAYASRDLESALREEFDIPLKDFALRGVSDVPPETMRQINEVLQGKADPMALPKRLREPVGKLRDHVDRLSDEIISDLKAKGNEKLAATIEANKGVYLTRSYRIFDDPNYAKGISESQLGPVREQIARDLQEVAAEKGEAAPVESFYRSADTKLREMIADWSDKGLDKLFRQGKLGSKDLTQFMKRTDISPEMRALMGEYKDPVVNYVRSVTKMARYLGDQKFLNEVRQAGINRFLFAEGTPPKGFEHLLAADESSTMAPLNGLRTSKPIKDAFEQFNKSSTPDGFFWKAWFGLTAAAKTAKTVLSFLTQMRNLIGNPFFNLYNGHFNFTDYHKAALAQFADIAGDSAKWREYYLDATRHRLVDESAPAKELRESLMDAGLRDPENIDLEATGLKRVGKSVLRAPFRGYRIPDEMGKMVGWEAEKATLRKAHPEWTEAQVNQEAAARVRNTYPTYSMVPEWVKQLRRQPLFGPFMTFAYEIFRTGYHGARYAAQDLHSGNPELQAAGRKRVTGMLAAIGGGTALSALSRYAIGLTKDTEDDIRRFLPPWSDNAQLVFFDHDGTEVGFMNYSYLNPYSYLVDPFVAVLENNEQGIFERSINSFGELLRPFTNEQMLFAAMQDVMRNKTERGKEVYNPQDNPEEKWAKATAHLATAIEPGSSYRLRNRIIPSFREEAPGLGRKLDPATEITAELTGMRLERFDFKDAIKFRTLAFARDERDAERIFKTEVLRDAPAPATVAGAYRAMEESRFKLWEKFYGDIAAARRQGVDEDEIMGALRQASLSRADIGTLMDGRYRPKPLSAAMIQWLDENQRPIPYETIDAIAAELEARPFATAK